MLTPSALGGAKALPGAGDETEVALERGLLIHRLLEDLSPLPPAQRLARGQVLAAASPEVLAEAMAVLNAPALAPILSGDALVEVALSGSWRGRAMWGIIDRLLIEPERVLAVGTGSAWLAAAGVLDGRQATTATRALAWATVSGSSAGATTAGRCWRPAMWWPSRRATSPSEPSR